MTLQGGVSSVVLLIYNYLIIKINIKINIIAIKSNYILIILYTKKNPSLAASMR